MDFADLTVEQEAKARVRHTRGGAPLAREEDYGLSDEQLKRISGGWVKGRSLQCVGNKYPQSSSFQGRLTASCSRPQHARGT